MTYLAGRFGCLMIAMLGAAGGWVLPATGYTAEVSPPIHIGVVVPGLAEHIAPCSDAIRQRVPLPAESTPYSSSPNPDWERGLSRSRRSFSLLDFASSSLELDPILASMRERNYVGPERTGAELLAVRLAAFRGDEFNYHRGVSELAKLHLFRPPDKTEIPPDVLRDLHQQKQAFWNGGDRILLVVPKPERLRIHGATVDPDARAMLPISAGTLVLEAELPDVGWFATSFNPAGEADRWSPLTDSAALAPLFSPPRPAYFWTTGGGGRLLLDATGQRKPWRPGTGTGFCPYVGVDSNGDSDHNGDAEIDSAGSHATISTTLVPPSPSPSPSRPILRSPWLWTSVAGAAILTTVLLSTRGAGSSGSTGALSISW